MSAVYGKLLHRNFSSQALCFGFPSNEDSSPISTSISVLGPQTYNRMSLSQFFFPALALAITTALQQVEAAFTALLAEETAAQRRETGLWR